MSIIQTTPSPLPLPRVNITIRPGTPADVPFMDALQKKHTKQVGWMPTKQFEGKIAAGHVLIAESVESGESRVERNAENTPALSTIHSPLSTPIGYLIGQDRYFKRDDVGIIYQINVLPEVRRSLVAASLLRAQFERSAYGCRLYCCWCAQDIAANHFWESMGFVPLAYRAGSRTKNKGEPRVHIFWQKRIRDGDVTSAWWFPSQTGAGAIREDRLVLPIPPGTHWSDAKPVLLPEESFANDNLQIAIEGKDTQSPGAIANRKSKIANPKTTRATKAEPTAVIEVSKRPMGLWFAAPTPASPAGSATPAERPKRPKQAKTKNDPKHVTAARELRDRYLDEINTGRFALPSTAVKYDVVRTIAGVQTIEIESSVTPGPVKLLTAA